MTNLTERLDKHLQKLQESFDMVTITPLVKKAIMLEKASTYRKVQQAMLNCFKTGKFIYSKELEQAFAEQVAESITDTVKDGEGYDLEEAIGTFCYTDELDEGEIVSSLIDFEEDMEKQGVGIDFINAWQDAAEELGHKLFGDPICKAVAPFLKRKFDSKEVDNAIKANL